ncbi:MAG: MscL family protein, partial [Succinivibrio sp.]
LSYGAFIQTVLDFIIIAFAIFLTIKVLTRVKNAVIAEKAAEPAPVDEKAELLKEIRDLLKEQSKKG